MVLLSGRTRVGSGDACKQNPQMTGLLLPLSGNFHARVQLGSGREARVACYAILLYQRAKLNEEVITWVELTEMQQRVWLLIGVVDLGLKMPRVTRKYWLCVCALSKIIYFTIFFTSPLLDVDAISSLRTWSGRATRGTVMTGYPRSRTSVKISHEFQSACIGARRAARCLSKDSRSLLRAAGLQITGLLPFVRLTVIALIL